MRTSYSGIPTDPVENHRGTLFPAYNPEVLSDARRLLIFRLLRCEFTLDDYHKIASDATAIERGSLKLRKLVPSNARFGEPRAHKALIEACRKSRWSVVSASRNV